MREKKELQNGQVVGSDDEVLWIQLLSTEDCSRKLPEEAVENVTKLVEDEVLETLLKDHEEQVTFLDVYDNPT